MELVDGKAEEERGQMVDRAGFFHEANLCRNSEADAPRPAAQGAPRAPQAPSPSALSPAPRPPPRPATRPQPRLMSSPQASLALRLSFNIDASQPISWLTYALHEGAMTAPPALSSIPIKWEAPSKGGGRTLGDHVLQQLEAPHHVLRHGQGLEVQELVHNAAV